MKSLCKSVLMGLVIGVMTMLPVGQAYCQSAPEPAIVISIAKFKEQMDDVNYLLTASGFPEMKFMASAMIKGYTKGLDTDKDAGVLLYFNEDSQTPDFVAFVPVTDIDEMLDVVAGMAEVEEGDDLTTIITDDGTELAVKERDGYAFISNKKEMLDSLPDSPATQLGDLSTKYNLSARVFAQRIPQKLRDQVLELIRESSEMTIENMDDDLQAGLQRKNLDMQMKQMKMLLQESDTLTIGMVADKDAKKLVTEIEFTGLPNSELAAKLAEGVRKEPSRFSGFLMEGATFTLNQCANMNADDAKEYSGMLDDLVKTAVKELDADGEMSEEELKVIEKSLNNLVDVAKATLAEGVFDSCAVLMLADGEINFAGGAHIADPKKFEETVKDLANMAQTKLGEAITVNLNSGSHKDITFHSIIVQVPEDEEEMRDSLGDEVTLIIGIGNKAVYFGAGSNPVETLKKAVDGPERMLKFIKSMPIFKALDEDKDNFFSMEETEKAVAAYKSLDKNEDGEISIKEMMPDESQTTGFMRSLPITKAIDKDNNGVLAMNEVEGAVAALKSLDKNEDGKISTREMMDLSDLMQFNIFVAPILKFAANMEGDPSVEAMATALTEAGGDRIRGTYNLIENGGTMRLEMQDGILGLIKVGFDAFSQGGGGFPGANDDF